MQALLLSAGLGTRLKPLSNHFPKCLTPIQGRPLLGIWLQILVEAGFRKILINLHYMPELVRSFVEQTRFVNYVEWVYEPELLGTAGTLIQCRKKLNDAPLLLIHADNISHCSLQSMWRAHEQADAWVEMTMMTFTTDNPRSCGIIEHNDKGGILAFHEKVAEPPGDCANAAVYILNKSLIDRLDSSVTDFSTQVVERHLAEIQTWHNGFYHRDIGMFRSLLRVSGEFAGVFSGPVTEWWVQYWSDKQWQRLHCLAKELAHTLCLPVVCSFEYCDEAAVLVIEEFDRTSSDSFLTKEKQLQNSVVLIGRGALGVIRESFLREYLLFINDEVLGE